jgi:hypothetical protein
MFVKSNSKKQCKRWISFFDPFRAHVAAKFAKCAIMTKSFHFALIFNTGIKNGEIDADFQSV